MSLSISQAASVENGGIKKLSKVQIKRALQSADSFNGSLCKFVPSSGAATRMFKPLFENNKQVIKELKSGSNRLAIDVEHIERYYSMPKGLIPFHRYSLGVRTPFEEHLVEGALYAKGSDDVVNLHFTISKEHRAAFKRLCNRVVPQLERDLGCKFNISFSVQSASTDVQAYTKEGKPFLLADGSLLKRPGGHGALLKNLGSIDADFIFIKNIDNVVKENLLEDTVHWKRVLLGRAVELQGECYLHILNICEAVQDAVTANGPKRSSAFSEAMDRLKNEIDAALKFLSREFSVAMKKEGDIFDLSDRVIEKLNRPIRVCGMVKNEGQPGGGPFICNEADGSTSLQILESVQIEDKNLMKQSTHFNPVDIVCCIKNFAGEKFNLKKFADFSAALNVEKSFEGKTAYYKELPGLWNGSMSRWNTQFIEVPLSTFNPVKSVQDLLSPAHS